MKIAGSDIRAHWKQMSGSLNDRLVKWIVSLTTHMLDMGVNDWLAE